MSKFFINRPIVAMVISIIMVIVGVVAMLSLPTSQFPNIVPPEVVVQATYPGADAKTLEQSVATPIEQQVTGVDHMNYMYSTNANNGAMSLTVDFDIATNPDIDQVLTQLRVNQATPQLPAQVNTAGVTVIKSLASPLMFVMLYSPKGTYDTNFLVNYAYINMADELTRVPGVARVQVFGGQYAMRVWVDPNKLAKLGVTVPQIVSAMQVQNNVNPAGQIGGEPVPGGQEFTYTVLSQGRLVTPEQFGQIVIRANPDGSVLRLQDVARIELGSQTYNVNVRYNGQIAAGMAIFQLPGSNAVAAADAVYKKLAELQKRYPTDIASAVPLDTTKAVTQGLHEIVVTLVIALGLVILVVYIFLQGWRATLIPLLAVPVSLIGTFVVFPALGFSINTLSLLGLVLAIGLVVDDAIVVVEAVEHHIEEGMSPKEASIAAMEQVASPVVAIALILAAVFIPTAAVPGITGRLYQQFAITIAISVLFSAFNALTLSPALCALLLKPKKPSRGPLGAFFRWFNSAFGRTRDTYVRTSGALIRKSGVCARLPRAGRCRGGMDCARHPQLFPARRGPGLSLCRHGAAQRGIAATHDGSLQARRGCHSQNSRREEHRQRERLQPAQLYAEYLYSLLLRHSEAMGPAEEQGRTVPGYPAAHRAGTGRHPGRHCVFVPATIHSRCRHVGWCFCGAGGSLRRIAAKLH